MELVVGGLINFMGACLAAWLGVRLVQRQPRYAPIFLLLTILTLLGTHLFFRDRLFWAALAPGRFALTLTDPIPPLAFCLIGQVTARLSRASQRTRWGVGIALTLFLELTQLSAFLAPPPALESPKREQWLVLQTHGATCGAASAATLLVLAGLESSESELVRLCLSRETGTPRLGLYRGLLRRVAGTDLSVRVVLTDRVEALRVAAATGPLLLCVDINPQATGILRAQHAVVLRRFLADGGAEIGDPLPGITQWSEAELRHRWHGEALQLISR